MKCRRGMGGAGEPLQTLTQLRQMVENVSTLNPDPNPDRDGVHCHINH